MLKTLAKIFLLSLFLSSFVSITSSQETNATVISFNPEVVYEEYGYLTFTIQIDNATNVYAFGVTIEYPKYHRFIMAESIEKGDFLDSAGSNFFAVSEFQSRTFLGIFSFGGTLIGQVDGANGNGSLAIITFKILNAGEYPITITYSVLLDSSLSPISHETKPTYVLARGNKPSGLGYERYFKEEIVDSASSYNLGSLLAHYNVDSLLLKYTGDKHWKFELSEMSLENADLWYEESITGNVEIYNASNMTLLDTFGFEVKIECFDQYGDGSYWTLSGYNINWWEPAIDLFSYEFNIKRMYELHIDCENGSCNISY